MDPAPRGPHASRVLGRVQRLLHRQAEAEGVQDRDVMIPDPELDFESKEPDSESLGMLSNCGISSKDENSEY